MFPFSKIRRRAIFLVVLLLGAGFYQVYQVLRAEAAPSSRNVLTVTGMLEEAERTDTDWILTVTVGEHTASGPLGQKCRYYDPFGKEISRQIFLGQGVGKVVTLELHEKTGEITQCDIVSVPLN
jgi:hypothetical protein